MSVESFQGCRILVAEDDYLVANDVCDVLIAGGAEVLGPYPTVAAALEGAETGGRIDAAILDVNLRGEMVFPVALALSARDVPFVFATGYDEGALPGRFATATRLEKPVNARAVAA